MADKRSAQHMIEPVPGARALQRPEVAHFFDHADHAERSRRGSVQSVQGSMVSTLPQCEHTVTLSRASATAALSGVSRLFAVLEQMQGGAPGRTRTKTRQFGEQLDQPLDFRTRRAFRHQKGSFNPGGRGRPPVTDFISSAIIASTLFLASLWAAMIRSSTISFSSGFSSEASIADAGHARPCHSASP